VKAVAEQELIQQVIGWVKENGLNGASHTEISESTNLLETGLLDSFAFVDLVLFIEKCTQKKLDLLDVNPEEFTVVKSLCHLALRNGH
jgi:acyl carrier protein